MVKKYLLLFVYVVSLECVKKTPAEEVIALMVQRYVAGDKVATIAKDLGVCGATVIYYAQRAGIPSRRCRIIESRQTIRRDLAIVNEYRKIAPQSVGIDVATALPQKAKLARNSLHSDMRRYRVIAPGLNEAASALSLQRAIPAQEEPQKKEFDDIAYYLNSEFFEE